MDAVSATDEAFSFVDSETPTNNQITYSDQTVEEEASDFEGFGSMFD